MVFCSLLSKCSLFRGYTLSLILCIECRNTLPMHKVFEHILKYSIDFNFVFLTVRKRTGLNGRLPVKRTSIPRVIESETCCYSKEKYNHSTFV